MEKVRKSGDVEFAIIRAGYRGYRTGKIVTDLKFEQNIKGAAENGIDMGLYFLHRQQPQRKQEKRLIMY